MVKHLESGWSDDQWNIVNKDLKTYSNFAVDELDTLVAPVRSLRVNTNIPDFGKEIQLHFDTGTNEFPEDVFKSFLEKRNNENDYLSFTIIDDDCDEGYVWSGSQFTRCF